MPAKNAGKEKGHYVTFFLVHSTDFAVLFAEAQVSDTKATFSNDPIICWQTCPTT
jgi:hypothetical protein